MADIASKKKKPYFTISTGMVGSKAHGGDAIEIKVVMQSKSRWQHLGHLA